MSQSSYTPGDSSNSRQSKDTKKKSKRKVADTSIGAWKVINERGQVEIETKKVYNALEDLQPATSRRISEALSIARTNITRTLYNLEEAGKIKVAFKAKCPDSKITVKHYSKINWEPIEQEDDGRL